MSENIPPSSAGRPAATPVTSSESTSRGLPYYEKLRRDLRDTLQKKRVLDKNLATLEDSIYRHETAYLEETSAAGNVVKGFDNYIKSSHHHHHSYTTNAGLSTGGLGGTISGSAAGGGGGSNSALPPASATTRRKTGINEMDRIFTRSSTSYYNSAGVRDTDSPSSATTTPGHAPTPATGGFAAPPASAGAGGATAGNNISNGNNSNNKKKKKKKGPTASTARKGDESETTDAKPSNKRARISYGPREQ